MHSQFLENEAATVALAHAIAPELGVGDVVALQGDLGAGKTAFARAIIRSILGDGYHTVPSPTFALVQHYDGPNFPIAHFDLYRLQDERDLDELGFFEAIDEGLTLIEWPDRAGRALPSHKAITFAHEGEGRRVTLEGFQYAGS